MALLPGLTTLIAACQTILSLSTLKDDHEFVEEPSHVGMTVPCGYEEGQLDTEIEEYCPRSNSSDDYDQCHRIIRAPKEIWNPHGDSFRTEYCISHPL